MTAPTHLPGNATLTAPIGLAALSAVQPVSTYPSGALYPSATTFPGQMYVAAGVGAAMLAPQSLAAAAIQKT